MIVAGITVSFKKTVSDGNYGNETAEVSYTIELEYSDDRDAITLDALQRARWEVAHELMRSESITVRRKLNPPSRLCGECREPLPDEVHTYLHPACDERLRAERAAQRESEQTSERREDDLEEMPF